MKSLSLNSKVSLWDCHSTIAQSLNRGECGRLPTGATLRSFACRRLYTVVHLLNLREKRKLPYLWHVITNMGKRAEQYSEAFSRSTSQQSLSGTKVNVKHKYTKSIKIGIGKQCCLFPVHSHFLHTTSLRGIKSKMTPPRPLGDLRAEEQNENSGLNKRKKVQLKCFHEIDYMYKIANPKEQYSFRGRAGWDEQK